MSLEEKKIIHNWKTLRKVRENQSNNWDALINLGGVQQDMSVCFDSSEEVLSFMGQGRATNQSPWVLGGIRKIRFSKEFRRRRKEAIVVQQLEPSIHKTMVSSSCSLGIYWDPPLENVFLSCWKWTPFKCPWYMLKTNWLLWKAVKSMRQSDEETSLCLFFYFRFFFPIFGTSLLFFTKRRGI